MLTAYFCVSSLLIFGLFFDQTVMQSRDSFSNFLFALFFQLYVQSHDFGTSFGIQFGPKWVLKRPSGTPKHRCSVLCWCLVAHSCFHESIAITVPLGHGGFQKIILSMADGSFANLSTLLCVLFYIKVLSQFYIKHG